MMSMSGNGGFLITAVRVLECSEVVVDVSKKKGGKRGGKRFKRD